MISMIDETKQKKLNAHSYWGEISQFQTLKISSRQIFESQNYQTNQSDSLLNQLRIMNPH